MIRAADPDDAAGIAALWNWMIAETLATFTSREKSIAEVTEMIAARKGVFFVDGAKDEIRGFVTFGAFRSGPGYAATCEHSVIVHQQHQGAGVGKGLIARIETAAVAHDMHVMIGAISSANPTAIGFHAACGFSECGRLRQVGRKAGQWLDLVLMQKVLTPDRT